MRGSITLLLLALLAAGCAGSSPRILTNISRGWRFHRADPGGAEKTAFDDSPWTRVDLPHTWNAQDGQDGGDNYFRGAAWYRRALDIPASYRGKSVFLRFEGAATVAQVYVNGHLAGTHRGNFGAFCFDITKLIRPGMANLLAVRVDNSKFDDVPPLSGDFTIFGGIYRDAWLLALDPLDIDPTDDGSSGVYLKQTRVDASRADVEVTTKLRNDTNVTRAAKVTCSISDARGRVVQSASSQQSIAARGVADAVTHVTIDKPHLWNGRADPYVYTATITVREGDRVVDRITQPLGLRSFHIDPDNGFFLNGRRYALHGVNRHQERLDKGWAISKRDHEEDFALITEMGCTGIRLSHYQHADYAYELCDKAGLVVWAELPLVNDISHTPAFADNARQQLRELIKQNYNHPSICFWSLFNELALKNPDFSDERKLIGDLNELAHALDPTRITVAATHKEKIDHPVNWISDATAFNRYFGWYTGPPTGWPAGLDRLRSTMPGKKIGISEYGAGASIYQHELAPTTRPRTGGTWHPEEWQTIVHESAWKAIEQRPWLWGTFVWCMFDFSADARAEGDHLGRNDKGLVTIDRKTRKDAFYFYKANWNDREPVVHICESRFNPRPAVASDVKVYSNCDSVELTLDWRSLGSVAGDDCVFVWHDVPLHDGANRVEAIGTRGGKTYRDAVLWNASPGATTRLSTTKPIVIPSTRPTTTATRATTRR